MKMLNEGLSREEFVEAFKNVVNLILRVEKDLAERNKKTTDEIIAVFNTFKGSLETKTNSELSRAVTDLKELADKSFKEQSVGMNLIRDKVSKIREGKDGKDGKSIKGDTGTPGLDAVLESPEQIRDKLEKLVGKERISIEAIRGLKDALKTDRGGTGMTIFGGNRPLKIQEGSTIKTKVARLLKFTGATITQDADGTTNIAIAGGTPVYEEIPTNSGDSLNFTLANTPATGTFRLFRGGARQQATVDYTLTVAALVITPVLASGESLLADYNY